MIRFAAVEDIPAIMRFINDNWKEGHILSRDRELFEFQHLYGDEVSFVLEFSKDSELLGLLGYIPYGDRETPGGRDMFTAIWKVKKGSGFMAGTDLIRFLEEEGNCRGLYCVGLAERVVSIMKYLRKNIVDYDHYYMLNPDVEEYVVACVPAGVQGVSSNAAAGSGGGDDGITAVNSNACITGKKPAIIPADGDKSEIMEKLKGVSEISADDHSPHKSPEFIYRRYFEHPVYDYDLHFVGDNALMVSRIERVGDRSVLRIIDYIGDSGTIAGCRDFFSDLMKTEGYEYIDCLVCGMNPGIMAAAGFNKKPEALKATAQGLIIPEYFHPFVRENVTIHNFTPRGSVAVMFKGDGDQDRPN